MSKFIEIHVLQEVGVNASNCDELGSPKTLTNGPKDTRYRFSSQSITRSVKDLIENMYKGEQIMDSSSRLHHSLLAKILKTEHGFSDEDATILAEDVYKKIFEGEKEKERKKRKDSSEKKDGKKVKEKKSVVALISKYEIEFVASEIKTVYDSLSEGENDIESVVKKIKIKDSFFQGGIKASLFGRMFASKPTMNVAATVQRSHMCTTHKVDIAANIDSFTAMDELLERETGAGHMDEKMFSCGCFYKCWVISLDELKDENHLGNIIKINPDFDSNKFLRMVIKEICRALPKGKTNSFFNSSTPSFVLLNVVDDSLPLSYETTFAVPVKRDDQCAQQSINKLLERYEKNRQWVNYSFSGVWVNSGYVVNKSEQSFINEFNIIDELIKKVVELS